MPFILAMEEAAFMTIADLEAGLGAIRQSPGDNGVLELIVRRPGTGEREVLATAELDAAHGLIGDNWKMRGTSEKPANPEMQITVMNSRVIALVARDKTRWPLAGDQLYVDLDLSTDSLPAGTRLEIGTAIIEISAPPHTGCKKFMARFGNEAVMFVNSPGGRKMRLRGLNAKIVRSGTVRAGDRVRKLVP